MNDARAHKLAAVRDDVLADYKEGHAIEAICAEYAVARATVYRLVRAAGLPGRKYGPSGRVPRHCGCGAPTTSKTGTCRLCALGMTAAAADDPDDAGLDSGTWVLDPHRRVMVWQPQAVAS